MVITNTVRMDLALRGPAPRVDVVQDDKYSRDIQITLYENSLPKELPADISGIIKYSKPDGTGGSYDTLPDGTPACTVQGYSIVVALAPQVCTVPGLVRLVVALVDGDTEIHTFQIHLEVQLNPGLTVTSQDYYNVRGALAESGWTPNMYLGTDQYGKVVTKAAPEGTGGTGETVKSFAVTETDTAVTMVLKTENGSHTHVLNFDANGYPTGITVDGVAIPGTWEVAASE